MANDVFISLALTHFTGISHLILSIQLTDKTLRFRKSHYLLSVTQLIKSKDMICSLAFFSTQ